MAITEGAIRSAYPREEGVVTLVVVEDTTDNSMDLLDAMTPWIQAGYTVIHWVERTMILSTHPFVLEDGEEEIILQSNPAKYLLVYDANGYDRKCCVFHGELD